MAEPRNAKEVFLEALELDGAAREAFLFKACGRDDALLARVRSLLAAHERAERSMPTAIAAVPTTRPVDDLAAGDAVGPYRLVREIGSGGFGTVWLARQVGAVERDVALKVLKAGMDTREVVARFEAERRALARMEHPSIARILDGGATPAGRPYFAMEHVDGVPIGEHCRRHGLGVRARLELFVAVCAAIQHAHTKGVVHRDVKPSNVLVTHVGDAWIPKVIDFGIAKAVEGSIGDPVLTRDGQFVGTPSSMAPEQLRGDVDVDTRADVYGLGALLYELLTGVPPHGRDASGSGGIDELRRRVLEVEPRRPSLVVGPAVAPVTAREVRGELDWIVMRCLEKEPARRYDSVSVLANDVLRHLAGDPVLAGPPTLGYRVGKFVRRHATALVALLAVFAGLVVAVVTIEGEARRANAARIEADASAADARAELVRADAVAVFLEDVLMSLDPAVAEGEDPTMVLAMLARAERRLADDADGLPAVAADLHRIVGGAYFKLARFSEALPHLETAYDLRREEFGDEDSRTIGSALELAAALAESSRTDEAIDLLERQLPLARRVLGAEDDLALQLLGNLGATLHLAGRDDEAEPILRELEEVRLRTAGADDATTILASNNLADVLTSLGRHDEAAPRYEEAYDFQLRTKGPRDPLTLTALNNLASCLQEAGDLERAGAMLERALDVKREILPPGHPSLVVGLNNLASLMERVERADRADELRREAIDVGRAGQGLDSRTTLVAIYNHAQSLAQRGDDDAAREAEGLLDEFLGHAPTVFGDPSPIVVGARGLLADAKLELGDLEEAEVLARSASETVPAVFPPGDPAFVVFGARLATIRLARGEGDVDAILAELERRHAELVALGFTSSARHVAGTLESWYRSNGDAERADRWARESEG